MDKRRLDIYRATKRLASDSGASQSERDQAKAYVKRLQAQYPGIDAIAFPPNEDTIPPIRASRAADASDVWDSLAQFLKNAGKVMSNVGKAVELATELHEGVDTSMNQDKRSGKVTVKITIDANAVLALMDARPNDRKAAIGVIVGKLGTELNSFLTED